MKTGFTLAEVLVVTALLGILMAAGVTLFIYNNRFYQNQSGEIASINATREAADRINEFGRAAEAFVSSYVYNSTTYVTSSSTTIFKVPSIDSSGQILSGSYDHIIFGKKPGQENRFEMIVDAAPSSFRRDRELLLSDKLVNINFIYDNADLAIARRVSYDFRVSESGISPATEQVHGSATLRNK